MNQLFRIPVTFLLLTAFVAACQETLPTDSGVSSSDAIVEYDAATFNSVTDRVSVGGADICEANGEPTGCDANFSLTARTNSDGTASGQFHDQLIDAFGSVAVSLHGTVDCLEVEGNQAWISGVLTKGVDDETVVDHYNPGDGFLVRVRDGPDMISRTYTLAEGHPLEGVTCTDKTRVQLLALAHGQVRVVDK